MYPRLCIGGNTFTTPVVQECISKDMVVAVLRPGSEHGDLPDLMKAKVWGRPKATAAMTDLHCQSAFICVKHVESSEHSGFLM